jgi:NADPH-dependent 2,4-dienoyl-CoA reductase/sulfur reductase-like enzyme
MDGETGSAFCARKPVDVEERMRMAQDNRVRTVEIPASRLPVAIEADVVVAGGGTAGFVAAIAAARTGATWPAA